MPQKRQEILTYIFFTVLFVTFLILYFGYFKPPSPPPSQPSPELKKEINIDFHFLESQTLKELILPTEIESPTSTEVGRENPFLPY